MAVGRMAASPLAAVALPGVRDAADQVLGARRRHRCRKIAQPSTVHRGLDDGPVAVQLQVFRPHAQRDLLPACRLLPSTDAHQPPAELHLHAVGINGATVPSMKFILGEPMKPATKRLAGW
jgi:hypothetical protein